MEYSKAEFELEVVSKIPIASPIDLLGCQMEIYVNMLKCKTDLVLTKSYNREERNRPVIPLTNAERIRAFPEICMPWF